MNDDLFGGHPSWSQQPVTPKVKKPDCCCEKWFEWELKDTPHELAHALCHSRQPFSALDLKLKLKLNDVLAHRLLRRCVSEKWAYAIRFSPDGSITQIQGRL